MIVKPLIFCGAEGIFAWFIYESGGNRSANPMEYRVFPKEHKGNTGDFSIVPLKSDHLRNLRDEITKEKTDYKSRRKFLLKFITLSYG